LFLNGLYLLLGENLLKQRNTGQAVEFFERGALKGDLDSDWILSCINQRTLKDSKERSLIEVFRAERDDGRALYAFRYFFFGSFFFFFFLFSYILASLMEEEEDRRRYEMLQQSAAVGCRMGYAGLAYCFYKGRAVSSDYGECVRLAIIAAGNPFADFLLARCYLRGHGVEQNEAEAVRLLERSANLDYNMSQSMLAEYYFDEGEYVEAVKWAGKVIYNGVWSETFVNILVSVVSGEKKSCENRISSNTPFLEFEDGHETDHNLEVIYALGKAMYFDVYGTTTWNRFSNEYVKVFGLKCLQVKI
jgi:hypothetical protein